MRSVKNRGYTLLELLLSIAISGTMIVLLFGVYMQTRSTMQKQASFASDGENAAVVLQSLSKDISNLLYEKWNERRFFFDIEKKIVNNIRVDTLNFPTGSFYHHLSVQHARCFSVTYLGLAAPEDESVTLYRKEDVFVDYENPQKGILIPILNHVKEFRVEVSGDAETWQEIWEAKRPPRFIRITLKWEETDSESGYAKEREYVTQVSPGVYFR